MKSVDFASATRPQRDVFDADGLVGMAELLAGRGRLDTDVAVRKRKPGHVIGRPVLDVQGPETAVPQPTEHRVVELDRLLIVQDVDFDVMHSAPAHHSTVARSMPPERTYGIRPAYKPDSVLGPGFRYQETVT